MYNIDHKMYTSTIKCTLMTKKATIENSFLVINIHFMVNSVWFIHNFKGLFTFMTKKCFFLINFLVINVHFMVDFIISFTMKNMSKKRQIKVHFLDITIYVCHSKIKNGLKILDLWRSLRLHYCGVLLRCGSR